ncbi:MAG: hypothetical protein C5B49_05715 [Bdellovibrio sp.]|nr:MAG: hypothetical protein C5B49_05715 [Bdellovibrio sp.]
MKFADYAPQFDRTFPLTNPQLSWRQLLCNPQIARKLEQWRGLPLREVTGLELARAPMKQKLSSEIEDRIRSSFVQGFQNLVLWNGHFQPGLSQMQGPVAVILTASADENNMAAERVELHCRPGEKCFLHLLSGHDLGHHFFNYEIDLTIPNQANCQVLHSCKSTGKASLHLGRLAVAIGTSASLEIVRQQDLGNDEFDFFRTEISLADDANLHHLALIKGGQLTRHDIELRLRGDRSLARASGLFRLDGSQTCDHHLTTHVQGKNAVTDQLYKGILDGKSRGIFNGRIVIEPSADGASSEQLNRNLLLSGTAEADSQPQLEIQTDNVKATHGSATGPLAGEEIFYLQSRGLAEEKAKDLLTQSFMTEIFERIESSALKAAARNWLRRKDAEVEER